MQNRAHEFIAPGQFGPIQYIAFAFCEGTSLAQWMKTRAGEVSPELAGRMIARLADAAPLRMAGILMFGDPVLRNHERALEITTELVKKFPKHNTSHAYHGAALYFSGDIKTAILHLDTASIGGFHSMRREAQNAIKGS